MVAARASTSWAPRYGAPRYAASVSPLPANLGRLTTRTATPAAAARSNWVRTGCHRAGSGSSHHSMWLSTRVEPGTRTVNPSTPCAPGGVPVPSETRLVGVVDGKPVVSSVAAPSRPVARSASVGATGAATGTCS